MSPRLTSLCSSGASIWGSESEADSVSQRLPAHGNKIASLFNSRLSCSDWTEGSCSDERLAGNIRRGESGQVNFCSQMKIGKVPQQSKRPDNGRTAKRSLSGWNSSVINKCHKWPNCAHKQAQFECFRLKLSSAKWSATVRMACASDEWWDALKSQTLRWPKSPNDQIRVKIGFQSKTILRARGTS